jgi:hypothetical protein
VQTQLLYSKNWTWITVCFLTIHKLCVNSSRLEIIGIHTFMCTCIHTCHILIYLHAPLAAKAYSFQPVQYRLYSYIHCKQILHIKVQPIYIYIYMHNHNKFTILSCVCNIKVQVSKSKHNKLIITMLLIERHVSAYSEAIIRFNKL